MGEALARCGAASTSLAGFVVADDATPPAQRGGGAPRRTFPDPEGDPSVARGQVLVSASLRGRARAKCPR